MTRLARIVVPGCPHPVTARGNRREPIFFEDGDQEIYLDILAEQTRKAQVEVWAYCLMPNHVHLILCPATEAGLARAMGAARRRWANFTNGRGRWLGHLFDGRYASVAPDESHLMAAVRYVALNPVRARLVERATDWPWSSAHAHLSGRDDGLVVVRPVLERVGAFAEVIEGDAGDAAFTALRAAEGTSDRPFGLGVLMMCSDDVLTMPGGGPSDRGVHGGGPPATVERQGQGADRGEELRLVCGRGGRAVPPLQEPAIRLA